MIPSTISYVLTTTHFHIQIQSLLLIPYYDYSLYVCQGGKEKGIRKCSALGVHVVRPLGEGVQPPPSLLPSLSLPPARQTLAPPSTSNVPWRCLLTSNLAPPETIYRLMCSYRGPGAPARGGQQRMGCGLSAFQGLTTTSSHRTQREETQYAGQYTTTSANL